LATFFSLIKPVMYTFKQIEKKMKIYSKCALTNYNTKL